MKKQIVLIIIISSISIYNIKGLTNQQVLQTLVGSHTRVFDKKNSYQSPMDAQDLNNWDQAIEEVKNFIKKNSKAHKKLLLNYFDLIKNANNNLINAIKIAYGQIINNESVITVYSQVGSTFSSIENQMQRIQNELEWVASKKEVENQATKLVSLLAKFVGISAKKARTNLESLSN